MGRCVILGLLCVAACGRSGYDALGLRQGDDDVSSGDDGGDADSGPELVVVPITSEVSSNWNRYAGHVGELSLDLVIAPCDAPSSYRDCLHLGEHRRVDVVDATRCEDVTIEDSRAAFEWQCFTAPQGVAFVSSRFAPGRGLRDIVDFETRAFRPMHVTVNELGRAPRVSADSLWWDNPIRAVPAPGPGGRILLNDPETIYLVDDDLTAFGVDLAADGITLLGARGVTVAPVAGPGAATCVAVNFSGGAGVAMPCIIDAQSVQRVWIEIDAGLVTLTGTIPLSLGSTVLARVHASHLRTIDRHGFQLEGVSASRFSEVVVSRGDSVAVVSSHGNVFRGLRLAGTDLYLRGSTRNSFDELTTFGGFAGINLNGSCVQNAFVRSLSFSHSGNGVQLTNGENIATSFSGTTVGLTSRAGLGLWNNEHSTFHLSVVVSSGEHGVDFLDSTNVTHSHLVSSENAFAGIELESASQWLRFAGRLTASGNGLGACDVNSTNGPALADNNCAPVNLSEPALAISLAQPALSFAFVGYVGEDDPANASDSAGPSVSVPSPGAAFDFAGASNRYRGWMVDGGDGASELLASANRNCPGNVGGGCWADATGVMRLVDWSLVAGAAGLYDNTLTPSGANPPFIPGAACPVGLTGEDVIRDLALGEDLDGVGDDDGTCEAGETCSGNTYLVGAIEIIDDYFGDDDGLCESHEACIYAPNHGAYQGHGRLGRVPCTFQDGVVEGVRVFAYELNGYPAPTQ